MNEETMRMLDAWREETLHLCEGVTVERNYNPQVDYLELMWVINYVINNEERARYYSIRNIPYDIGFINIQIDIVENGTLPALYQSIRREI